jgi:hypothetical protein
MAGILRRILLASGYRIARKAAKAVPILGTALAIGFVGYEIKKKGIARGLIHTALDATPVVGFVKNTIELFTGDWLPDKPVRKEYRKEIRHDRQDSFRSNRMDEKAKNRVNE